MKFFTPWSRWTWYIAEYDPEEDIAWGYCRSGLGADCDEFGTVRIGVMKKIKGPAGLGIERDLDLNSETTIQDILDKNVD